MTHVFCVTPEYTLGIWFGNKDGAPAAVLTGARAAAPAAAVVMTALYRNRPLPAWPSTEAMFRTEALCAESGLTACSRCAATRPGTVLCDVPLQACRGCRDKKAAEVMIVSPAPGTMSLIRQHKPWLCHCAPNLPMYSARHHHYVGVAGRYPVDLEPDAMCCKQSPPEARKAPA